MNLQAQSPVEQLREAEWSELSSSAQAVVLELVEEVRQLKLKVSQLQELLRRNAHNSSQPPSRDKAEHKPTSEVEAPARPRRRGGQVGQRGQTGKLLPTEAVEQVVVHRPVQCEQCGAVLLAQDATPYRFQVTELPVLKASVTEHQVQALTCARCGAKNHGTLPPEVAASQFGPNLVGLMALLMGCYRLSKRQVVDVLTNCFGIELAASSVVNQQQAVSAALAQSVDVLQRYVQQPDVCNVDETGWRQADQAKCCWLWVVVTTLVTVFHIASSRSGAIARQLLGDA